MRMFHSTTPLFLLYIICLSSLMGILTARATTKSTSQFLSNPEPAPLQGVWKPRSRGGDSRVGTNIFEKRMYRFGSPNTQFTTSLKAFKINGLAMILPVADAARYLEEFYSSIAIKASTEWQSRPEEYSYNFVQGAFQLSFASIGEPIPWSFVKGVANMLWEVACTGFAEFFDAYYKDDTGSIYATVSLRFVEGGGGPSSGWSATSDFREGSVPSVGS